MRVKYWSYLLNDEGQPIENANVYIYEAGTLNAVNIFTTEVGGVSVTSSPQVTTNIDGYFEFWIADNNEIGGYNRLQKFRIKWFKSNIAEGDIDNVSILPIGPGYYYDTTDSWTLGTSGYYYDVVHGLGQNFPVIQFYDTVERKKRDLTTYSISENILRVWNNSDSENFEVVVMG